MRLGALRADDTVDAFWEAEVRCCIAVKPSHSESCLILAGELLSYGLTQNEILSTLDSTLAIGRHRKLLLACFDLKHLQASGLCSALELQQC